MEHIDNLEATSFKLSNVGMTLRPELKPLLQAVFKKTGGLLIKIKTDKQVISSS